MALLLPTKDNHVPRPGRKERRTKSVHVTAEW